MIALVAALLLAAAPCANSPAPAPGVQLDATRPVGMASIDERLLRQTEPQIVDVIEAGNDASARNHPALAARDLRHAADLLTARLQQDSGDRAAANALLHLGLYFALTGDRTRARAMWSLYQSVAGINGRAEDRDSSAAASAKLGTGDARGAFAIMNDRDRSQIGQENGWRDEPAQGTSINDALEAGSQGRFAFALDALRRATGCSDQPMLGYPFYAIGVAYWALHDRRHAIDAWLAATLAADQPTGPGDMAIGYLGAYPATTMLLRFYS